MSRRLMEEVAKWGKVLRIIRELARAGHAPAEDPTQQISESIAKRWLREYFVGLGQIIRLRDFNAAPSQHGYRVFFNGSNRVDRQAACR